MTAEHLPRYIACSLLGGTALGALCFIANRSAYFPSKYPEGFWDSQTQLHANDVWLTTRDGVRIHGWWVNTPSAGLVTLFLHGNAGNVTHRFGHFQQIAAAGSSILVIDYRVYGKSSGRPAENGLYTDAETAYNHLVQTGVQPDRIILHGESLGTAVAVDLASRLPCAAVVLEAPFTSARDVARSVLPVIGPLLVWGFDSRKKVALIRVPMLFIQGDRDEVIAPRLGEALFAAAPQPKSFWIVSGAGHNDIVETAGAAYAQRLRSFYLTLAACNHSLPRDSALE